MGLKKCLYVLDLDIGVIVLGILRSFSSWIVFGWSYIVTFVFPPYYISETLISAWIGLPLSILFLAANIAFIFGAVCKKKTLLLPWLLLEPFIMAILAIPLVVSVAIGLLIAFPFYVFYMIFSLYKLFDEENKNGISLRRQCAQQETIDMSNECNNRNDLAAFKLNVKNINIAK